MGTLQVIFCEMLIRVVQYFCEQTGRYKGTYRSKLILLKKNGNAVSYNGLEIILQQLQKLAPELHRVHFLSYLNGLSHDDYLSALENLHCYFDYRMFNGPCYHLVQKLA
ncbi:anaphase-promoting complex subunit 5-like isoform X4 [Phaseolus vulgaris]|uniref:anaphase-promoting complex subunit 5-like isoform X4 n=1 Tax=Phaseolus vulgaris TaxID=3885 RepID=UPI0035CC344A